MSIKKTVKEIKFELDEIENLFDLYKEELFELNREPNQVELTALASVLHSFYCGIEKIFLIIAKRIDKNIPWVEKKVTGKKSLRLYLVLGQPVNI